MLKSTIRFLKAGEVVPGFPPKRYTKGTKYVRLRWKVGVRQYVEVWEHRVRDGRVVDGIVHHKNHNKHDNSEDNRVIFHSDAEHLAHHRTISRSEVLRLYSQGVSRSEIARTLSTDSGNISKILTDHGVPLDGTPKGERHPQSKLNNESVLAIRDERNRGETLVRLAEKYGVTHKAISAVVKRVTWTHI